MKKFLTGVIFTLVAASFVMAQAEKVPDSKIVDVKQLLRDVEILSADDMEGRRVGTPGGIKAREYILKRFKEIGLLPTINGYLQPFPYKPGNGTEFNGANIFGVIKGKKHPEKYVAITAHYDHLGVQKGVIYNGADDNASGVAAILAMAAYFKKHQPDTSLILVAFDAEETGGTGSGEFTETPPVKLESIVMNVNIDMIGQNEKNELYAVGTYHYPFLKTYLDDIAKDAKVKLLLGHDRPEQGQDDWTRQSDHGNFHRKKIPFIYFGVEDHKDYHRPTDDYPTLIKDFYVGSVETVLAAITAFDRNAAKIEAKKAK